MARITKAEIAARRVLRISGTWALEDCENPPTPEVAVLRKHFGRRNVTEEETSAYSLIRDLLFTPDGTLAVNIRTLIMVDKTTYGQRNSFRRSYNLFAIDNSVAAKGYLRDITKAWGILFSKNVHMRTVGKKLCVTGALHASDFSAMFRRLFDCTLYTQVV